MNYYRDAVFEEGELRASESALSHGAWPCAIASFTTALGLFSLYISNLTPIKNFGLYSGLGVSDDTDSAIHLPAGCLETLGTKVQ